MNITELSLRRLSLVLCASLAGCIITASDDDDVGDGTDGGDDVVSVTIADDGEVTGMTSSIDESGESADSADDTTTGPSGDCSDNLIMDPGFEAGTPSTAWTEDSATFGTPICDAACTDDPGAVPYMGDWWAWFGGVEEAESASVEQTVTIAVADSAVLSFRFSINASAGTGDDEFAVIVDETAVFMVTDAEVDDFDGYTHVDVDLTDFADGNAHRIRFASDHPGTGLSNFFLDEVHLVTCTDTASDSSGSEGETGTTAADGSSTGTEGDTTTDGGSSS